MKNVGYPLGYRDPDWDGTETEFADKVLPARIASITEALNAAYVDVLPEGTRFGWMGESRQDLAQLLPLIDDPEHSFRAFVREQLAFDIEPLMQAWRDAGLLDDQARRDAATNGRRPGRVIGRLTRADSDGQPGSASTDGRIAGWPDGRSARRMDGLPECHRAPTPGPPKSSGEGRAPEPAPLKPPPPGMVGGSA